MTADTPRTLPDGRPVPLLTGDELPMSELTLLGLVQRLAEVERNRFQRAFAGLEAPPVFEEESGYALDAARGIEEYARHNGHADILRERIDAVTGA
jgi:hypothetical protein